MSSHLGAQLCRNVIVGGRRTSIRMEHIYWQELQRIGSREGRPVNEIISMVDQRRGTTNLTAALRVFVICYMRENCGGLDGVENCAPAPQPRNHEASNHEASNHEDGTDPTLESPIARDRQLLRMGRMTKALDVVGPPVQTPRSSANG